VYAGMTLERAEQLLIEATLRFTLSHAAKMLGLDRSTLYVKLKRYGIKRDGLEQLGFLRHRSD
jgi:transcriptional regulator of acetoin/glycerol metabolism